MTRRLPLGRRAFLGAGASAAAAVAVRPSRAAAAPPTPTVIVNATAMVGDGTVVERATLILERGRIARVAEGLAAPAGASVLDAQGAAVTPGLVAVGNPIGLVEIELEPSTDDLSPRGRGDVHPSFSAIDAYNPASSLIPVARLEGITSVVTSPDGGLVPGTAAWVDLGEGTADELAALPVAAVRVSLHTRGIEAGGGARPEAFARFRELLDDARLFAGARGAYDRRAMRESRASRLDLERMQDVLARRVPLLVDVSRASDIHRVLEIGRAYGVRLVLAGVEEGWQVAPALAAAKVPVLVRSLTNLPEHFDRLGGRADNAALLARAGVPVVIVTPGPHDARHLRQEVGNAIAWGLDPKVALRAVTLEAARTFGLDKDYGALRAGAVANVVVWTGADPFEVSAWPRQVFVRGAAMPMRSRQTALFERYRRLPAR